MILYTLDIIQDMILVVRLDCILSTFDPQLLDLLHIVQALTKHLMKERILNN